MSFVNEIFNFYSEYTLVTVAVLFVVIYGVYFIGFKSIELTYNFSRKFKKDFNKVYITPLFCRPLSLATWIVAVSSLERKYHVILSESNWNSFGHHISGISLTLLVSFIFYRILILFSKMVRNRYNLDVKENLQHRKIITQWQYVEKVILILIVLVTIGFIFLRFDYLSKLGGGLLASAGIAGVILSFAAQESISNLIAGFQIAFSQPFRIDDAVIVEGEWGWIEEINLTYVVVRIWDLRRLVLPIKYFTTQPFQNWTRRQTQIIGSIFIHLDYMAPVDEIRAEFENIVKASSLWDQGVQVLQVTDATDKAVTIRALASAKDSPTCWDLRCEVREKLIAFIQKNYPESLPKCRLKRESASEPEATT